MLHIVSENVLDLEITESAADRAVRAIPPLWPLSSSVAVNPFLGQADLTLAEAGALLAKVAGARVTMPRRWYRERIASGVITEEDLREAWAEAPPTLRPADWSALAAATTHDAPARAPLPSVADIAATVSGIDWPGIITERLGAWTAGYFDEGQALWAAPKSRNAYASWRMIAMHDLTPEILGLKGFASRVFNAPEDAALAINRAVHTLSLPREALEDYFHRLLMTLGGAAQYARYRLWQAERMGGSDETARDLLAIRIIWEEALFEQYRDDLAAAWRDAVAQYASPIEPDAELLIDTILQRAAERAFQRSLALRIENGSDPGTPARPSLQAVFCIDVRSEIFRRAQESLDAGIQTLGFAGFFGIGVSHRRFASDIEELRLPVLLRPPFQSCACGPSIRDADQAARYKARAKRAWERFKLAAVSSFAFVEATGLAYVGKLLRDALGLKRGELPDDPPPRFDPPLDAKTQVAVAEAVLRAMSLTRAFAPLVLIVGHGANVVNNPHASALHCGACGGYSGEVNARLLASLLNDPAVRAGLAERGIAIPSDTLFIAALHDTTTDDVRLYAGDHPAARGREDLAKVRRWLAEAGKIARMERALRLPGAASEDAISQRSRNWAEIRPEWGLAGCQAFIAAPRQRTRGKKLEGRVFLHDYAWRDDPDFRILEQILTAPVIVASWISLQYYGSTVAPDVFGSGNKLLHNVTGGIGVLEGNGGFLRPGLPWQSVHDGETYVHEPLRLTVCIEAPHEAIGEVLANHPEIRPLFDNGWIHLFALDERGRMAWQYVPGLAWKQCAESAIQEPVLPE
jgi:uncharacterized protein YbcC (UPF0753/DUF2309 family)